MALRVPPNMGHQIESTPEGCPRAIMENVHDSQEKSWAYDKAETHLVRPVDGSQPS